MTAHSMGWQREFELSEPSNKLPKSRARKRGATGINRPVLEYVEQAIIELAPKGMTAKRIEEVIAKQVKVTTRQARTYMGQVYAKWEAESEANPEIRNSRRYELREYLRAMLRMAMGWDDTQHVMVEGLGMGASKVVFVKGKKTDLKAAASIVNLLMRLDGIDAPIKVTVNSGVLVMPGTAESMDEWSRQHAVAAGAMN